MSKGRYWGLREAKIFAGGAHAGQKYGSRPFTVHLAQVAQVAKDFGLSQEIQIAAWLHDIIEDTPVTYNDIKVNFGTPVAELVYAVTDELGRNRHERKEKTLAKCQRMGRDTVALKLCDRIANMRFSKKEDAGHFQMYLKEAQFFRDLLYNPVDKLDDLWEELDKLSKKEDLKFDFLDNPREKFPEPDGSTTVGIAVVRENKDD